MSFLIENYVKKGLRLNDLKVLKKTRKVTYTGGPLLTLFFQTLEKQPCKRRSDLVLNGQMRVSK